jgi:hypothetical protein
MSSVSTSNGSRNYAAVMFSLPLLSKAAAVTNEVSEFPQQQQHQAQHQEHEEQQQQQQQCQAHHQHNKEQQQEGSIERYHKEQDDSLTQE